MDFIKEKTMPEGIKEAMASVGHREESGSTLIDFSSGNVGKMIVDSCLFSKFQIETKKELDKSLIMIGEALKKGLMNSFYKRTTGLSYTPAGGTNSMKFLILKYFKKFHGVPLSNNDLDRVIVTAGGQQVLSASLRSIKPKTTIYLPHWEYSPTSEIVRENGCQEVRIPTDNEQFLQLNFLIENAQVNSVFYMSMPNNPTGYTSPKDLNRILDIMTKKDGGVIWDAPYLFTILRLTNSKAIFDSEFQRKAMNEFKKAIEGHHNSLCILSSLSKTCLLSGLRCGFATGPSKWIDAMNVIINRDNISSPTTSFLIAKEALELFIKEPITHEWLCKILAERLTMLIEEGIPLILPKNGIFGALYALVKTNGIDAVKFSNELIDKFGIVTIPGNSFYGGKVNVVRISLVATPWSEGDRKWEKNLKMLKKALI